MAAFEGEPLGQPVLSVQIFDRLDGEIRIDGACAVAEEKGEMHHFARFAGFDDKGHLGAGFFANQVIVHGRQCQQARDRRIFLLDAAVRKDQDRVSRLDGERSPAAQSDESSLQLLPSAINPEKHRQRRGKKISPGQAAQFFQVVICQNRVLELQRVAVLRRFIQEIALASDEAGERHDQLFANRIDRRIRHLRKELLEIMEQQLRFVGKASQRRIRPHRTDRFLALRSHRGQDELKLFVRISERTLSLQNGIEIGRDPARRIRQIFERRLVFLQPLP